MADVRCEPPRSSPVGASNPGLTPSGTEADLLALARATGLGLTAVRVLVARGVTEPKAAARFLDPKLAHLTPPDAMADRSEAVARLARAVRTGERVVVFGDYDCDGITATAILTEVLRRLGAEVVPLLASRFDGGYGVTGSASERIAATGAGLLVTADCGSSDHAALAALGRLGLDVVVIDHHLVPPAPLPVVAFLNPRRPDCGFPYDGLASCGLALSVAAGLRAELGVALDLRELLDLVAIGTIADVAPLDGDNRVLVRAGLARLRSTNRAGLVALLTAAGLDGQGALTSEDVAFRLAPRLNAPGRLGAPDLSLELLLCGDPEQARALAEQLEACTVERRRQQERILAEARAEVERCGWRGQAALVLGSPEWNHGIVGIAAGRLAAELGCPVAVIGFDASGLGRGSVRGPRGSRLFDALTAVAPLLERFGGHQAAAGFEVRAERLDALREAFAAACGGLAPESVATAAPFRIEPGEDLSRVVSDLERLEPFGERNPTPRFRIEGEVLSARAVRGGHLKLELRLPDGGRLTGFGPDLAAQAPPLQRSVAVEGSLRRDRWRGGEAVEVGIDKLRLEG